MFENAEAKSEGSSDATASMAERAYAHILRDLLGGRLRGGDVVQESRLAERFGLSRTPVRDALGRLEGEGLLTRNGRLLMVRRVTVKEFLDLLHIRLLIEPEAAALACGALDPALLRRLRDSVVEMPHEPSHEELWSVDDRIHASIIEALHNDFLAQLVRDLRRRTRLFEIAEVPDHRVSGRDEHLKLLDALIAKDYSAASAAMREHIERVRSGVIEHLRKL
jgi:DNA-binding GntR family transcriptional regulator